MKKEYKIPEEVNDLLIEGNALESLADKYMNRPFSYKKVKSLFVESRKLKSSFWRKVYAIYPELSKVTVSANTSTLLLKIEVGPL